MRNRNEHDRISAIARYFSGESPLSIIASLGKSKSWFYKWLKRFNENDPSWNKGKSKCPHSITRKTSYEIEEAVRIVRLSLL